MTNTSANEMLSEVKPAAYYPALTGVRAIAAYLVFFHHGNLFSERGPITLGLPASTTVEFLQRFLEQWHVGVPIFFVLSGFLIAARYQDRIQLSWPWARRYMQNRFARIYPLYFLLTIITFIAWQAGKFEMYGVPSSSAVSLKDKLLSVFMNLSFLRGFFGNFLLTGLGQGWSLTVEECFYISAPFVLLATRRKGIRLLFFPVFLLAIGLVLVQFAAHLPFYNYAFMPSVKFMLDWTFFGRATEFGIGMGLAILMKRQSTSVQPGGWITAVGIGWMLLAVLLIIWDQYPQHREMNSESYVGIALNNVVFPLGVAIFFWGLMHERSLVSRLLSSNLFQILGKSSYAFYLVHGFALSLSAYMWTNPLVVFFAALVAAYVLWRFIEEPLHKKLKA